MLATISILVTLTLLPLFVAVVMPAFRSTMCCTRNQEEETRFARTSRVLRCCSMGMCRTGIRGSGGGMSGRKMALRRANRSVRSRVGSMCYVVFFAAVQWCRVLSGKLMVEISRETLEFSKIEQ